MGGRSSFCIRMAAFGCLEDMYTYSSPHRCAKDLSPKQMGRGHRSDVDRLVIERTDFLVVAHIGIGFKIENTSLNPLVLVARQ